MKKLFSSRTFAGQSVAWALAWLACSGSAVVVHAAGPDAQQHLIENPRADWRISVALNHADGVYAVGDRLSLTVQVPQRCYLHIVNVSPQGEIDVLWPRPGTGSNLVEPGQQVRLPDPRANPRVAFEARLPCGKELIVCFATTTPLNLQQPQDAQMFLEFLAGVSKVSPVPLTRLKSFVTTFEQDPEGWTAQAIEITTRDDNSPPSDRDERETSSSAAAAARAK